MVFKDFCYCLVGVVLFLYILVGSGYLNVKLNDIY